MARRPQREGLLVHLAGNLVRKSARETLGSAWAVLEDFLEVSRHHWSNNYPTDSGSWRRVDSWPRKSRLRKGFWQSGMVGFRVEDKMTRISARIGLLLRNLDGHHLRIWLSLWDSGWIWMNCCQWGFFERSHAKALNFVVPTFRQDRLKSKESTSPKALNMMSKIPHHWHHGIWKALRRQSRKRKSSDFLLWLLSTVGTCWDYLSQQVRDRADRESTPDISRLRSHGRVLQLQVVRGGGSKAQSEKATSHARCGSVKASSSHVLQVLQQVLQQGLLGGELMRVAAKSAKSRNRRWNNQMFGKCTANCWDRKIMKKMKKIEDD